MDITLTLILFVYGLLIGSFLNAGLWRLHQQWGAKSEAARAKFSLARGRSRCPKCNHPLSAADLVPLFSWLYLKGKCRYCRKSISSQYPLVELFTGVAFAVSGWLLVPSGWMGWFNLIVWLVLLSGMIFLAVYDAKHLLLPDKVLLPLITIRALQLVVLILLGNLTLSQAWPFFTAGLAIAAVFYAIVALSRGQWMGGGDIKLVFLLGLLLGPQKSLLALFIAFNSAAIIGVVLIATRRKGRRDVIPFGPFLIAGTIIAFLIGEQVIQAYLRLLGWPV